MSDLAVCVGRVVLGTSRRGSDDGVVPCCDVDADFQAFLEVVRSSDSAVGRGLDLNPTW